MKITYLGHSGFLVEEGGVCLVFDYFRGAVWKDNPEYEERKWYIFSSHSHGDHFNQEIFELMDGYRNVTYIFSKDIWRKLRRSTNITEGRNITYMKSAEVLEIDALKIKTLKSTDLGVAFIVTINGYNIYHAGDLNWWHWEGESLQYNNNMKARYFKEIAGISENVDVACLPLDPKQQKAYYMGMKYFIENVNVKDVFPMHFWGQPEVVEKFYKEYGENLCKERGCRYHFVAEDGQVFENI